MWLLSMIELSLLQDRVRLIRIVVLLVRESLKEILVLLVQASLKDILARTILWVDHNSGFEQSFVWLEHNFGPDNASHPFVGP